MLVILEVELLLKHTLSTLSSPMTINWYTVDGQ